MRGDSEAFAVTLADGRSLEMQFRRHARGPDRRFAAMEGLLVQKGILRKGRVAASESLLVEAAPLAELTLELLRKEPRYLLQ